MTLVGKIREIKLCPELIRRYKIYLLNSRHDYKQWQLSKLNIEWKRVVSEIPYYKTLKAKDNLPDSFYSLREYIEKVPSMNRETIHEFGSDMYSKKRSPQWWRKTGGTTSQPIQLPAWKSERKHHSPNQWLGRHWLGLNPSDRAFWIWGHSHLLGSGLKGWFNSYKRRIYDLLLGYYRFSAYELSDEKMREAGNVLLHFHPDYILGYSVALDAFARANKERSDLFHELDIKVVIGLAEAFPTEKSVDMIADVLGATVVMEYGSVETGVMATLLSDGVYRVFWQSYLLDTTQVRTSGNHVVRVTSLYPRCFPLIRYELGDEIETLNDTNENVSIKKFKRVIGRCNDFVELSDGSKIHSEAFTHVVRGNREIERYQVIQSNGKIIILIKPKKEITNQILVEIRRCLEVVHSDLANIEIKITDTFQKTVAGKTPMIMRKYNS